MVQAPDGGYVLAGYTNSFGAGLTDARLVKTDSDGNKMWDKTYGTEDNEGVYSVVATSDGGFALAGGTFNPSDCSFWLVKA